MTRRQDSPYSDSDFCPYPDGLGTGGGDPVFFAQNEGQKVESGALHYPQTQPRSPKGGQGDVDE